MNATTKGYVISFVIALLANLAAGMLVVYLVNRNQQNSQTIAQKSATQPPRQVTVTTTEEEGTNT